MSEPTCGCTPLNRRLMAHLLRVPEGDVHEDTCRRLAMAEARRAVLDEAIAAVRNAENGREAIDALMRLRDGA